MVKGGTHLCGLRSYPQIVLVLLAAIAICPDEKACGQSLTFAGNAQHTGLYTNPAQPLTTIRWTTPVDLTSGSSGSHYGAPLVTAANTVIVPVKASTGFRVSVFEAQTGRPKYNLNTDYRLPSYNWTPVYQPAIALPPSGPRLYFPGAGGTVYYVEQPDSNTPGTPIQQCFYTDLTSYQNNAAAFNSTVFINTPLTADENGVMFFGFRVQQTAPAPLNTTNSGFARIDPAGNASFVLASVAASDTRTTKDSHNCAPALSNDGATLYVVVKGGTVPYLLGLDSATLATKFRAALRDPRNGNAASVPDDSTASPMVAPDGDVFFGIYANPDNGSRGFLLHFSGDLRTQYPPGAFGWDNTAAIVPSSMLPVYTGPSLYLLFSKYNNYVGTDGYGVNRIAVLDPHATQIDPHSSAPGLVEMREVITAIGCVPSPGPTSVREWCINSVAVNPPTSSVFVTSEDGLIYRWNLAANGLTEALGIGLGVSEPYVPSVIGPDGTVYAMNGGTLSAIGALTNVSITLTSSVPDQTTAVAWQPITFTAVVASQTNGQPAQTGSVTFQDLTYQGQTRITSVLASNLPLSNGVATLATSGLIAASNYLGCHYITATYSGDATFQAGSATLVQRIHQFATTTVLTSAPGSVTNSIVFHGSVLPGSAAGHVPSGFLSFWDGTNSLAQLPLTNAMCGFMLTNLSGSNHAFSARYSSDSYFASSSVALTAVPPLLSRVTRLSDGTFQFGFSNYVGLSFTILASPDVTLPLSNWPALGPASEIFPGQFQFSDPDSTNNILRFYRVRSP
jgi:hypothetical protein